MAASEILYITKDGKTGRCERWQLAAMVAKGWQVTAPPAAPKFGRPIQPEPLNRPVFVIVYKGERPGRCEMAQAQELVAKHGWSWEPKAAEPDLRDFLAQLDPDLPDLWTVNGRLKVTVVWLQYGVKITQEQIEEAWPGFSREALINAVRG